MRALRGTIGARAKPDVFVGDAGLKLRIVESRPRTVDRKFVLRNQADISAKVKQGLLVLLTLDRRPVDPATLEPYMPRKPLPRMPTEHVPPPYVPRGPGVTQLPEANLPADLEMAEAKKYTGGAVDPMRTAYGNNLPDYRIAAATASAENTPPVEPPPADGSTTTNYGDLSDEELEALTNPATSAAAGAPDTLSDIAEPADIDG